MKPQRIEKINWSRRLAYAVGLITTDGNLSIDGRHMNLTSKDLQLLKTFKKCLNLNVKIGEKKGGFSDRKYYQVQFGDIIFYRWLLQVGLTPHKSKTISSLKIPNKYFPDFLRGHFDGDGSCYSYWDKRWDSSFMFYMNFYSASEKHIIWLREKIKNLIGVNGDLSNKKRRSVFQLKYAKRESRVLISKIYYKKDLPRLERKYKKIKSILKTDKRESDRI